MSTPTYSERLHVPLRWWAQGTMLIVTFWLVLIVATPPVLAFLVTGLFLELMAAAYRSYGGLRVIVDDELRVGRARIGAEHLGVVEALDADATRRAAGVEADARAYLAMRPYVSRAVRVEITDPADPAPYWLVSSRAPEELASAVTALVHALRSEHG